jgi:putative ABC transport system substrate-binding protein
MTILASSFDGRPGYRVEMDRRRFLLTSLAGVVAAPLCAEAQAPGKVYRIGFLRYLACSEQFGLATLRQGLRDLGYVEGHNIVLECRDPSGKADSFRTWRPS